MRTTSTKQKSHLISRQVCAVALIALFVFAPNPPESSMAQSEDPKDKKPAPTTPPAIQGVSLSLRPRITYREKAKYTVEAREKITHGVVELNVVFRTDGSISDIKVVNGLPYGLTERAIDAARKIRFEPAIKDGQPVHVRGNLEFAFHLYDLEEKSIQKMLRNDFPVLSKESVQVMAKLIYKSGDRDSEMAWHFAKQCLEIGVSKLPQSEQEELTSLTVEALRGLDKSDQRIYQKLMELSKTEQKTERSSDYYEMRKNEFRFRGISRLPDEKRRRVEALYQKAATLGTEFP